MLLICCCPHQGGIDGIFSFIEDHSVLVGIVTSVIVSSLWLRKFIKQKRAEAFFGFYAKLSLRLKALQTILQEKGQLNISNAGEGNIYSLIYLDNYIRTACPRYTPPTDKEFGVYKAAAKELKDILLKTENNVYPPGAKRKEWYNSQYILFSFCEFLEDEANRNITNEQFINGINEPKHITKCKSLVEAMDYIQKSIERAKY